MLKIVSPTGCVHIVDNAYSDKLLGRVTLCNHVNYRGEHGEQFRHHWPSTTSTVTCKRCLASLKRITDKLETKWTIWNIACVHRFPHPELGIMCIEPKRCPCYDRLHSPNIFKKCLKRYCPKRSTGQHSSAVDMALIEHVITGLGKDIVRTDKRFKAFFVVMSKQCSFRKPTKMMSKKVDTVYQCTNPKLVDPQLNWRCAMGACPWINRALDWKANNDM